MAPPTLLVAVTSAAALLETAVAVLVDTPTALLLTSAAVLLETDVAVLVVTAAAELVTSPPALVADPVGLLDVWEALVESPPAGTETSVGTGTFVVNVKVIILDDLVELDRAEADDPLEALLWVVVAVAVDTELDELDEVDEEDELPPPGIGIGTGTGRIVAPPPPLEEAEDALEAATVVVAVATEDCDELEAPET